MSIFAADGGAGLDLAVVVAPVVVLLLVAAAAVAALCFCRKRCAVSL